MAEDPFGERPGPVETVPLAGVPVPTTCRDRVDEAALAAAVRALDEHGVTHYRVSPVGGLQVAVGVHRPDETVAALREALAETGAPVAEHGVARGFLRLRVDVTDD